MSISEAMLGEFDMEMAATRKVLERCPEDKYGWKPHAKSWDMATLASHLATMVGWAKETLTLEKLDYAPPGAAPYQPTIAKNREELLALFDKCAAAARTAIANTSDAEFMKPWTLLAGGKEIFTMPRMAVMRGMIMNHAIHHRGQLTVYLRLNDAPVPALYGPSADEQS